MLGDVRTKGCASSPRTSSAGVLLRAVLLCAFACAALGALGSESEQGVYVVSATFNGGSSASAALGSHVDVAVTVRLVGSDGRNSWWCSTRYTLACPETGVQIEGCALGPSPGGDCYCNWGCTAASWEWESAFTARFTVPVPAVAGTYDVTLCAVTLDECGVATECSAPMTFANAVTATCGPADTPTVELGPARVLTCAAPSLTLTATVSGGQAPYTYLWTPGNAASQSLVVTAPGTYTVKVTGGNGCAGTDSVTVTENKTAPTVEAGEPQVIWCGAPTTVLTATATGGTEPYRFLWSPGSLSTQSISVTVPGSYSVQVAGANGCSAGDSVIVSGIAQWSERLVNGGFERGLDGWRLHTEEVAPPLSLFTVTALALPATSAATCAQTGGACLQGMGISPPRPAMLVQDVTSILESGRTYRLSGWMQVDQAAGASPAIALIHARPDGTIPPGGIVVETTLPVGHSSGQWFYCLSREFTYAMPADCAQTWVALAFPGGTGNAWWDDVSLMELAPSG